MPLPLPYHDGDYENCDRQESSLRRALNLAVMNLNWLHLGCPARPPASYNPSGTMSSSQLQVLSHLRMCFLDWSQAAPITADSMGRSAGKIETLEDCLIGLEREAHRLKVLLGSGRSPAPTTSASRPPEVQAKDIEAHRIKFAGSPSFDPSALLPPVTRTWYQSPLECAMPESGVRVSGPAASCSSARSAARSYQIAACFGLDWPSQDFSPQGSSASGQIGHVRYHEVSGG